MKLKITKYIMWSAFFALIAISLISFTNFNTQSEIKSLITTIESRSYDIALFKRQYKNLPGNIPNATQIWGEDLFKKTCYYSHDGIQIDTKDILSGFNGSGDGFVSKRIISINNSDPAIETTSVDCHLALAGLIEKKQQNTVVIGKNITESIKTNLGIENKNFSIMLLGQNDQKDAIKNGNFLYIKSSFFSDKIPPLDLANPEISSKTIEVIDKKIDSGQPGTGLLRMFSKDNYKYEYKPCCSEIDQTDGSCTEKSQYVTTNSKNSCYMQYKLHYM